MNDRAENKRGAEDILRLLARLDANEFRAWQEYEKLRQKLVMFFEPHFRAPELAEEVLGRIARKADNYEISNVVEFAFGVARNVRKEMLRQSSTVTELADEDRLVDRSENQEIALIHSADIAHKRECFLLCLQGLAPEDRRLILEYYPPDDENLEERRQELARGCGMSWGSLRTRVIRLRQKLVECCARRYHERRSRPKESGEQS